MTIPISRIISDNPSVLAAGGEEMALVGLMLTQNPRFPYGIMQSFGSAPSVGAYFGLSTAEYTHASYYFGGYQNETQSPGEVQVAFLPLTNVGAWIRGAPINYLLPSQLSAISGTLSISVDGYALSGNVNLSSATSPSTAAGLIQTALNGTANANLPVAAVSASAGGAVVAQTCTFVGGINGNLLNVTATTGAAIEPGAIITVGAAAYTQITNQLTGTPGGIGTYSVAILPSATAYNGIPAAAALGGGQNVLAGTAMTATYGKLTLTGPNASGTFSAGQTLTGGTLVAGTILWGQLTGTVAGSAGTYVVSPSQAVSGATVTATAAPLSVVYDSISGGLLISSGQACPAQLPGYGTAQVGATASASSVANATGAAASLLGLAAGQGNVLSQGAAGMSPQVAMSQVVRWSQNFAQFWTTFDPDGGAAAGPTQKLNFSNWTGSQNKRYAYIGWDTDASPVAVGASAASCFSQQVLVTFNYDGTAPVWDNAGGIYAAFVAGCIAAINFGATNGRTTIAFRSQAGMPAAVTDATVYDNLKAAGYNFYGAFAEANQQFMFMVNGTVSGQFMWLDSYVNQIWMNMNFRLALINLVLNVGNIPYNTSGAAMTEAALMTDIDAALNFGAIRTGITLSSTQALEVNNQAGIPIAATLQSQGWYFQMQPAQPSVRQARTTPPIFFWYTDGGSIQQMALNSIEIM